jgi:hypothetical protein
MTEEKFLYNEKREKMLPRNSLKTKITVEQFRQWVIRQLNDMREKLMDDVLVERADREYREFYEKMTAQENHDAELYEYDDLGALSGSAGMVLVKGDTVIAGHVIYRAFGDSNSFT